MAPLWFRPQNRDRAKDATVTWVPAADEQQASPDMDVSMTEVHQPKAISPSDLPSTDAITADDLPAHTADLPPKGVISVLELPPKTASSSDDSSPPDGLSPKSTSLNAADGDDVNISDAKCLSQSAAMIGGADDGGVAKHQGKCSSLSVALNGGGDAEGPPVASSSARNKALLLNLWVLALIAGIVAIAMVGSPRMHEAEPGSDWHAISWSHPFIMQTNGAPVYLQASVLLPPWAAQTSGDTAVLGEGPHQGFRRRRALLSALTQRLIASRKLASSAAVSENATLPALQVYLAQYNSTTDGAQLPSIYPPGWVPADSATDMAVYNLTSWLPVTTVETCEFAADMSTDCLVVFQDVSLMLPNEPCYLLVTLNNTDQVSVRIHVNQMGGFGKAKAWCALVVIAAMLVAIAVEKIHRTWVAFVASFLMSGLLLLANMVPSLEDAASWIDYGTLALLFGMMIIVGKLKNTGVFEVMVAWALRVSKARMWVLTVLLSLITAFVSAFLDNVTTMLLICPVTIIAMETVGKNPVPLLVLMAIMSNIGGTATMVGDPPNLIIGNYFKNEIGFVDFILHLAPGVILAVAVTLPCLMFLFRKDFLGPLDKYDEVMRVSSKFRITNWPLLARSGYVTAVVVLAFLLHPIHHINPAWFAVMGATVLCVLDPPEEMHAVMESVEWDMLLFFGAMFVTIEGAVELGLIRKISSLLTLMIETAPPDSQAIAAVNIIMWLSAVFSALLDNIPYTIAMLPVLQNIADAGLGLDITVLAWALAFGACLGGNGTLIGASANIVTSGVAAKHGHHISFFYFAKMGVPAVLISVVCADVYMMLRYCL